MNKLYDKKKTTNLIINYIILPTTQLGIRNYAVIRLQY